MARPKRPWKNLADFARGQALGVFTRKENDFPCLACKGYARVVIRFDDSYEGRHDYGKCPECKGTGKGTQKDCKAAYRIAIAAWQGQKAHYEEQLAHWQAAQAKLTDEEKRALNYFGVRGTHL
jgi:hypothetical protein